MVAEEEKKNLFTEIKTGSWAEFYGLPLNKMMPRDAEEVSTKLNKHFHST